MNSLTDGAWNTSDQRLRKTFSVALVAHLLLLIGLSFAMLAGSPPNPSMDITLAHVPSEEAPDQADFIAQANQLGNDDQQKMLQLQDQQQPAVERQYSDSAGQAALSSESIAKVNKLQEQSNRDVMQTELP